MTGHILPVYVHIFSKICIFAFIQDLLISYAETVQIEHMWCLILHVKVGCRR